jgi:hypothetical protein
MGQSTISMAIFNSYVSLPEGISWGFSCWFLMNVGKKKTEASHFFQHPTLSTSWAHQLS